MNAFYVFLQDLNRKKGGPELHNARRETDTVIPDAARTPAR